MPEEAISEQPTAQKANTDTPEKRQDPKKETAKDKSGDSQSKEDNRKNGNDKASQKKEESTTSTTPTPTKKVKAEIPEKTKVVNQRSKESNNRVNEHSEPTSNVEKTHIKPTQEVGTPVQKSMSFKTTTAFIIKEKNSAVSTRSVETLEAETLDVSTKAVNKRPSEDSTTVNERSKPTSSSNVKETQDVSIKEVEPPVEKSTSAETTNREDIIETTTAVTIKEKTTVVPTRSLDALKAEISEASTITGNNLSEEDITTVNERSAPTANVDKAQIEPTGTPEQKTTTVETTTAVITKEKTTVAPTTGVKAIEAEISGVSIKIIPVTTTTEFAAIETTTAESAPNSVVLPATHVQRTPEPTEPSFTAIGNSAVIKSSTTLVETTSVQETEVPVKENISKIISTTTIQSAQEKTPPPTERTTTVQTDTQRTILPPPIETAPPVIVKNIPNARNIPQPNPREAPIITTTVPETTTITISPTIPSNAPPAVVINDIPAGAVTSHKISVSYGQSSTPSQSSRPRNTAPVIFGSNGIVQERKNGIVLKAPEGDDIVVNGDFGSTVSQGDSRTGNNSGVSSVPVTKVPINISGVSSTPAITVIGAIAGVLVFVACIFGFLYYRKRNNNNNNKNSKENKTLSAPRISNNEFKHFQPSTSPTPSTEPGGLLSSSSSPILPLFDPLVRSSATSAGSFNASMIDSYDSRNSNLIPSSLFNNDKILLPDLPVDPRYPSPNGEQSSVTSQPRIPAGSDFLKKRRSSASDYFAIEHDDKVDSVYTIGAYQDSELEFEETAMERFTIYSKYSEASSEFNF